MSQADPPPSDSPATTSVLGDVKPDPTSSVDTLIDSLDETMGVESTHKCSPVEGCELLVGAGSDVGAEIAEVAVPLPAVDVGESRLDVVTGQWTLFATGRSLRPDQFRGAVVTAEGVDCPFCQGREEQTPPAVWSAKLNPEEQIESDTSAWSVRVVPNLFPAVCSPHQADTANQRSASGAAKSNPGLLVHEPAVGGHEVIIESSRHTASFSELNPAEASLVFAAYSARLKYWRSVPGIRHVSLFKNVGRDAGASLEHSHSQLIATGRVPLAVQHANQRLLAHHARRGTCLHCALIRGELQDKKRLVSQSGGFVAFCPYASRFPYQIRITTLRHLSRFEDLDGSELDEAAWLALRAVRWLEAIRPGTAYNLLLTTGFATPPTDNTPATVSHSPEESDWQETSTQTSSSSCCDHGASPRTRQEAETQHWTLDIFPRVSRLAGFELGTGSMINPVYPEMAAEAYRQQARQSDPRHALRPS